MSATVMADVAEIMNFQKPMTRMTHHTARKSTVDQLPRHAVIPSPDIIDPDIPAIDIPAPDIPAPDIIDRGIVFRVAVFPVTVFHHGLAVITPSSGLLAVA